MIAICRMSLASPLFGGMVAGSVRRTRAEQARRGCISQCYISMTARSPPGAQIIRQIAALPYRIAQDGSAQVMLITSRGTGRWVIPKGNPIRGLEPHRAAVHEAYEEAGISGIPCPSPLGVYRYRKATRNGDARTAQLWVFPLCSEERRVGQA